MAKRIGELWNLPTVSRECGDLGKTFIYDGMARGTFPQRIKIGRKSVWNSLEIKDWRQAKAEGREWRQGDQG